MKLCQLTERYVRGFHAGRKAPMDVEEIARRLDFKSVAVYRSIPPMRCLSILYSLMWLVQCLVYICRVSSVAVVLVQYPNRLLLGRLGLLLYQGLKRIRKCRIVTFIHDINELRSTVSAENVLLGGILKSMISLSDVIVVHNEKMRDWLVRRGCNAENMIILGVFDYILGEAVPQRCRPELKSTIAVTGNLECAKAGYLKYLSKMPSITWHLYGPNFNSLEISGENITFKGSFPPESLPFVIEAGFGLVWDGDSINSCDGAFGGYLRFNNPHKLSCYLASGIPVIVWKESAVADFIENEKLGIAVSSLCEMEAAIAEMRDAEYILYANNAAKFSELVRCGHFTTTALSKALELLSESQESES